MDKHVYSSDELIWKNFLYEYYMQYKKKKKKKKEERPNVTVINKISDMKL
jgi:hypothetical protein